MKIKIITKHLFVSTMNDGAYIAIAVPTYPPSLVLSHPLHRTWSGTVGTASSGLPRRIDTA